MFDFFLFLRLQNYKLSIYLFQDKIISVNARNRPSPPPPSQKKKKKKKKKEVHI